MKKQPADILEKIVARTRKRVAARKAATDEELLSLRARSMPLPPSLPGSLRTTAPSGVKIIAEIKQASPSKGLIRPDFHPLALARELQAAGAAALSVLTEPDWFQGSLRHLRIAADNLEIPLLRKDFIVDPYQIYEARLAGASAVLLIASALETKQMAALARLARELNLAVLTEIHTEDELSRAVDSCPDMIGVNSRDLQTFETSWESTATLLARIPRPFLRIAESGIRETDDIRNLRQAGADAFLVGEILMRHPQPGEKLRELRGGQ